MIRHIIILYMITLASIANTQVYTGEYKELKNGTTVIDRFALVKWPEQIPIQARSYKNMEYDYTFKKSTNAPKVLLDGTPQNRDRAYVAIYHSPKSTDLKDFKLYRWGMGLNQMKFPMESIGCYYIIAIAKGYSFIQLYVDEGENVHVYRRVDRVMKVGKRG